VIIVRPARPADIDAMSDLLIASITQLCGLDHRHNPEIIAAWTANKTPEGVAAMLADPAAQLFVSERDGHVAAVGSVRDDREIALNYVHPAHRFAGVSRALLATMESYMSERGAAVARLKSTVTAHRFYLAQGWQDVGPLYTGRFIDAYLMEKRLA